MILNILDVFGIKFSLTFGGNEKFNTKFGLINTLLFFGVVLLVFIYYSQEMFQKNNPQIITTEENQKPNFLSFIENQNFIAFSVHSNKLHENILNESIFTVNAKIFIENTSLSIENQVSYINLNLEPCNENHAKYIKSNDFKITELHNLYCFSEKSFEILKLHGIYGDNFYQEFSLEFNKCRNNSKCASEKEIDFVLEDFWLNVYTVEAETNIKNFNTPIFFKKNEYGFLGGAKNLLNIRMKYSKNLITSDKGYLIEDIVEKEYMKINNFEMATNNIIEEKFAYFSIECDKSYKITQRIYTKLPSVLAEVGGMLSIVQIFFQIWISPIVNLLFIQEFANRKYLYEDNNENNDNETLQKNKNSLKVKKIKKNIKFQQENIFELNSVEKEEGKVNQIKITNTPCQMFSNFTKKNLKKVNVKFKEIMLKAFCKRKSKNNDLNKFYENIFNEMNNLFDLLFLLEKVKKIEIMKNLLFDDDQIKFIDSMPKFIISKKYSENQSYEDALNCIIKKEEKNEIDEKILKMYSFNLQK